MARLIGKAVKDRAKELEPVRTQIKAEWLKNPAIRPVEVAPQYGVSESTVYCWFSKWRKKAPGMPQKLLPTWEAIVQAAPDSIVLGGILLDGLMGKIQLLNSHNEQLQKALDSATQEVEQLRKKLLDITEDRRKVFQAYNELLTKLKTGGHFTIDNVQHVLAPRV